ncbi:MAG: magnesium transporter [Lachnospiraceae bacterium]|nr:magnesium transporter [Lachnospiraceae bacterium]
MEEREEYEVNVQHELLELIRSDLSDAELLEKLSDYHENDIANVLEELSADERKKLYRILGTEKVSDIFAYLEDVEQYFQEIGLEKSADVLEEMDADDAVDILENLPEEYREALIEEMDDEAAADIQLITSYDESQFGSLMTTNYISIRRGSSVKGAMKELIRQSEDNDNITTIYVEEADETYYGAIDLKDLIRARSDTDLETIISTSYPYVRAIDDIGENIDRIRDYAEDSIPVLDDKDRLIGVLTAFDVVEAVDDEISEDYAKLAGMTAESDLNETLVQSIKKRIPWLITLLFLGLLVSSVIGMFTKVVERVALIVCFQSLILDMAGNGGTQSLAVTIRVLMDESLTSKEKAGHVFKEARVGLMNGIILGGSSFLLVGLYIWLLQGYPVGSAFAISGCVGIALCVALIIASLVGTLIPMFLHKLHVDPAVASGPLITTTNDLIAAVTYYGLAWILLINVLHIG